MFLNFEKSSESKENIRSSCMSVGTGCFYNFNMIHQKNHHLFQLQTRRQEENVKLMWHYTSTTL